jgi:hypothetical protein
MDAGGSMETDHGRIESKRRRFGHPATYPDPRHRASPHHADKSLINVAPVWMRSTNETGLKFDLNWNFAGSLWAGSA